MPTKTIVRETDVIRSTRVMQLEGMFDVPPTQRSRSRWRVHLPIEDRHWQIGLIVGPSGCGKTTVAHEVFGNAMVGGFDWPDDRGIVDAFPDRMSVKEIAGCLSSVGFSSPPSWLRPFCSLSNGEQFRATLARSLAEAKPNTAVVVDEFTSVVDRNVAKIGSAAVAKAVRARNLRFVAVGCHYDVIDWLTPDWIYEPGTDRFEWRLLRRRPKIRLLVRPVHSSAWRIFKRHHYLAGELHPSSRCFVGFVDLRDNGNSVATDEATPAVFTAVLPFPHASRPGFREHRTVCLPDFQGVGIGNAMSEFVASLYAATGKPYRSVTANPAMIRHRARSKFWRMTRPPGRGCVQKLRGMRRTGAVDRLTASFEYVGPRRAEDARRFGIR